jgi:tetratricopeptide (TPR) repeat protein
MKLISSVVLIFITFSIYAQDGLGVKDVYKMKEADHKFYEKDYRAALNLYRQIMETTKSNALLNFKVAKCHYELKSFDLAVEYYRNAKNIDPEVKKEFYFEYGKALHKNGMVDEALEAYQEYRKVIKNKKKIIKKMDLEYYEAMCGRAKELMASPVPVEIINLGREVNSREDDYGPSISADGKTMIFTSRRASTKGGGRDLQGDHKFYEDIYISEWDSENKMWKSAENIPGKLNTEGHDAALCIGADGKVIYLYRNDGVVYIGDIFVSKINSSGNWSTPKDLGKPINTSYFESSASITSDGNRLYFVSEKPKGGFGQTDIYYSDRISRNVWSEPVNLGDSINTPYDEVKVFIHPDGKTLFFSSDGHNSMGGYDIFMSKMRYDSTWSKPVNLGYPINTVVDDVHFILSTDKKTGYYSTFRKNGFGEKDIYKIDMTKYPIASLINEKPTVIIKGKIQAEELEDLLVQVYNGKEERIAQTKTNEEGEYFLTIPEGEYTIRAGAAGYKVVSQKISVYEDKGSDETTSHSFDFKLVKLE